MKTIRNLTPKALKVPLPRGKSLRLGPKQDGAIHDRGAEHPPLVALVEAGAVEIFDGVAGGHGPRSKKS